MDEHQEQECRLFVVFFVVVYSIDRFTVSLFLSVHVCDVDLLFGGHSIC